MTKPEAPGDGVNEEIAQAFIAARRGGPRLSRARADALPLSALDPYDVQRRVAERFGPVGGFKFAQRPGEAAIAAPIYAADIHTSAAEVGIGAQPVGIELEVGFRILSAPPDPAAHDFRDRLRACVAPLAAIELVQTRLEDSAAAAPELRLADNQLNGGLVIGASVTKWDGRQLSDIAASLSFDGVSVLNGPARPPFGDPFDCLCALTRMIGDHCGGLQAGQIVITGSLNGLPYLPADAIVRGRIETLGDVAVDIVS